MCYSCGLWNQTPGERLDSVILRNFSGGTLRGKALTVICAYEPNTTSRLSSLLRVSGWDSIVLLGDFNAHVGNDGVTGRDVIERNDPPDLKPSGVLFLDLLVSHGLSIMNIMIDHKVV